MRNENESPKNGRKGSEDATRENGVENGIDAIFIKASESCRRYPRGRGHRGSAKGNAWVRRFTGLELEPEISSAQMAHQHPLLTGFRILTIQLPYSRS